MRFPSRAILLLFPAWAVSAPAQQTAEQALAHAHGLTATARCGRSAGNEILVCGGSGDKYRLPFPDERTPPELTARVPGDIPRASSDTISYAPCGIFRGQRRCGKAESLRYGYGGGSDPLSLAVKLGTRILDPDADVSQPSPLPKSMPTEPR
jgi:hypothetical protein